jgi:hypothetical protein
LAGAGEACVVDKRIRQPADVVKETRKPDRIGTAFASRRLHRCLLCPRPMGGDS